MQVPTLFRAERAVGEHGPGLGFAGQGTALDQQVGDRGGRNGIEGLRLICHIEPGRETVDAGKLDPNERPAASRRRPVEVAAENRVLEQVHDFVGLDARSILRDHHGGTLQRDIVTVQG